jgi:ADP-heptose:LPS heptosyltransferase
MKNLTVKLNFPDSAKPSAFGTAETGLRIILNVNSQASSRRVPLFKAASIAKALIRHFNCLLVLTGTVKDKPYIDDLKSRIDCPEKILDLSGKTTLSSLAMIMKHVDMVVSTDSGPSHLANSLGTKLLILGGPADDSNTGPYEKYNYSIARAEGMSCAPCVKNVCPFGTSKCLLEIKEALIVEKAAALLGHSN